MTRAPGVKIPPTEKLNVVYVESPHTARQTDIAAARILICRWLIHRYYQSLL